jgi:predicted ABC-class ATPase
MEQLRHILSRIDGKGYKAYKDLQGKRFSFPRFTLSVQYVQGDPFASPSQVALSIPLAKANLPKDLISGKVRRTAMEDFLARSVNEALKKIPEKRRGSGKSGMIAIDAPKQEVLERSCIRLFPERLEARLLVGLPARGRRIAGDEALKMLTMDLPKVAEASLFGEALPENAMKRHVQTVEDQETLRHALEEKDLVAFVANGALLPRRSGIDQRPLAGNRAVLFESPPSLEVEIDTPNAGKIRGMGIPKGVTLIVGGGFHGKSTLLGALEHSVYNHAPGDGRERVVTIGSAVKIRAEDGRRVEGVDISPFINNLPFGRDTTGFRTDDASGSTSQAANIMEALEAGSKLLLLDEDTSATNFMIRDARMQRLVATEREPITPFIDRARELYEQDGVSTILVMGGSGDYFDTADQVIMMDHYRPRDVTAEAREIAEDFPTLRAPETPDGLKTVPTRIPLPESFDPRKGRKTVIRARGKGHIQFGRTTIELDRVEQIVDESQTRAIGDILFFALREGMIDGKRSIRQVLQAVEERIDGEGLDVISPFGRPLAEYARPRPQEISAAINRLRTLAVGR